MSPTGQPTASPPSFLRNIRTESCFKATRSVSTFQKPIKLLGTLKVKVIVREKLNAFK